MRCAACKFLRRRCSQDCMLAPYFPANNPQRFASVHRIFGASNITKMLQQLPVHLRAEAADCMSFEASLRIGDPVYGCVGIISQLQQQIFETENEIIKTRGEIAFYNAQQQQQQQMICVCEVDGDDEQHNKDDPHQSSSSSSWLVSSTQQDTFQLGQQQLGRSYQQSNI